MTIIREERIGGQRLILGDCLKVMPLLEQQNMVCTSPPYDDMRDYGGDYSAYADLLSAIECISALLLPGGVCMWNVADSTVDGSETGNSFRQALHAKDCGLRIHDTMIYCKEGVTFPDANRYLPCFEYMFIFSKGRPSTFSGIRDRRNKWRGEPLNGTDRQRDGSTKKISGVGRGVPEYGLRRNWWVMSNAFRSDVGGHPAPMPYAMADGHIRTWTNAGATVLDPFMGSGTTLVACQKLGRLGTGIEIDPEYFEVACKRVEEAARQPDMFVETPTPPEQLGLLDNA